MDNLEKGDWEFCLWGSDLDLSEVGVSVFVSSETDDSVDGNQTWNLTCEPDSSVTSSVTTRGGGRVGGRRSDGVGTSRVLVYVARVETEWTRFVRGIDSIEGPSLSEVRTRESKK